MQLYQMSTKREPKHRSPRKKLIRRDDRDHSQPLRFTVQILFAAINMWIGVQFYLWVRWAESGGRAFEVFIIVDRRDDCAVI
jgi:hypothetical protein